MFSSKKAIKILCVLLCFVMVMLCFSAIAIASHHCGHTDHCSTCPVCRAIYCISHLSKIILSAFIAFCGFAILSAILKAFQSNDNRFSPVCYKVRMNN